MKIGGKLTTAFMVVSLLTGIAGYFGIRVNNTTQQVFTCVTKDISRLRVLQDLRGAGVQLCAATMGSAVAALAGKNPEKRGEEPPRVRVARMKLKEALYRFGLEKKNNVSMNRHLVETIYKSGQKLEAGNDEFVSAVVGGAPSAALVKLKDRVASDQQEFLQAVDTGLAAESESLQGHVTGAEQAIFNAKNSIRFVTFLMFLMAVACSATISGYILSRIAGIRRAAERIGDGDLDVVIPVTGRDELGALAASFNRMAEDLKQSREEVVSAHNYLDNIIHSMIDSLIVVGPDGLIRNVNAATCTLLGYEQELVGQPYSKILADPPFEELIDKGLIRDTEKTYITQSGAEIPVAFSGSVMWNADDTLQGFVCIAFDITGLKNAEKELRRYSEELRKSNEDLRDFAYIISHDLRAPLVNIRGFSAELNAIMNQLDSRLAGALRLVDEHEREIVVNMLRHEVPEALDFINSSVIRMNTLISGILKLSRMGMQKLRPDRVLTGEVVAGIVKSLAHQMEQRQVTVTVGDLPELVVDRAAIEQIFGNLFDNAVKYLDPRRPGELEISAEESLSETVFHIRDNGRGIGPENIEKVFEIFRRAAPQDVPGDGLGLAFVKTLVRRLGGRIWLESKEGIGSTFSFSVPLLDPAGEKGDIE